MLKLRDSHSGKKNCHRKLAVITKLKYLTGYILLVREELGMWPSFGPGEWLSL